MPFFIFKLLVYYSKNLISTNSIFKTPKMKTLYITTTLFLSIATISCADKQPPLIHSEVSDIVIPIQNAQFLFKDYEENRVGLIEAAQNIDENGDSIPPDNSNYVRATRSLTVDYDTLKQYLSFIEQKADSAHIEIQGLRIYLGKYPNDGNLPDGSITSHPGAETIFLNPVMEYGEPDVLTDDVSFAIKITNGQYYAIPVGEILDETEYKRSLNNNAKNNDDDDDEIIQSLAGNHFGRRPPPPPPDDPDYD